MGRMNFSLVTCSGEQNKHISSFCLRICGFLVFSWRRIHCWECTVVRDCEIPSREPRCCFTSSCSLFMAPMRNCRLNFSAFTDGNRFGFGAGNIFFSLCFEAFDVVGVSDFFKFRHENFLGVNQRFQLVKIECRSIYFVEFVILLWGETQALVDKHSHVRLRDIWTEIGSVYQARSQTTQTGWGSRKLNREKILIIRIRPFGEGTETDHRWESNF